jgi:hypothetical protein
LPLFFYNALLNTTPLIWCKYDLSGLGYGKIEIYFFVAEIQVLLYEQVYSWNFLPSQKVPRDTKPIFAYKKFYWRKTFLLENYNFMQISFILIFPP